MSYCPKCGNKVDETMTFCPRCGAALKGATPSQPAPAAQPYQSYEKAEKNEKQEKQEKNEHPEKGEKQEKGEYGFIGFLIGGLVLIVLGLFSLLRFSGYFTDGQGWAIMLLLIGIIIIVGAIYVAVISRKRFPEPH
jgi:predicted lipid-binding transport protein (Tim44 family)